MAKMITLTDQALIDLRTELAAALNGLKLTDGKFKFEKTLGNVDRKAELWFTERAWLKMQTLIREFDKEVAWHGLAYRDDDPNADRYFIADIIVYPQEVTGATVNTDQEEYQTWLVEQEDDVFNNIRMQGHSHVNMSTTPSNVDLTHQERILEQLEDDMFYIFLIWNKRNEKNIKIYDMKKNVLFETADVSVGTLDDGTGMEKFLADAKSKVKERTYNHNSYNDYYKGGAYNGCQNYSAGKQQSMVQQPETKKEDKKQEPKKEEKISQPANAQRKGKRKDKSEKKQSKYSEKSLLDYYYGYNDDYCDDYSSRY